MYYQSKYKRKLYIATLIAMFLIIMSTILPAFADEPQIGSLQGRDGGVLDSAVDYLSDLSYDIIDWASDAFMSMFVNTFSPDFSVFASLESGLSIGDIDSSGVADNMGIQHSGILSYLWSFGFGVGVIVVNILLFFNLFMCIAGQAKNIRENPAMLFLKYLIIMAGMYASKGLGNYIMEVISSFWSDYVCALPYGTHEKVNFIEKFYLIQFSNGRTSATLAGFDFDILSASLGGVLYIITLFLAWKIFKEFLKLYVEIIERYFVLVMLIVFLPATMATAVSNNTKKIFSSYIRMIFSQSFVLLVNTCFMKIFFVILMSGGWNAGLLNYFACMAFLKVCQKIDSYMMLMGLNVSQTGGRVAGAFGGAMLGMTSAVRTLGSLDNARKNIGRSMADRGLREANPELFAQGQKMATPLADYIADNTKDASQIAQAYSDGVHMLNKQNSSFHAGNVTPITTIDKAGNVSMAQTNADGTPKDFGAALQTAGIPATVATELNNYGYDYTDVGSVKQLDENGQKFAIYDHNGVGIAGINGSTTYIMEKSERDAYIKQANTLGEIAGKPNEAEARNVDTLLSGDEYAHFLKSNDIPSAVQQLHGYGTPMNTSSSTDNDASVSATDTLSKDNYMNDAENFTQDYDSSAANDIAEFASDYMDDISTPEYDMPVVEEIPEFVGPDEDIMSDYDTAAIDDVTQLATPPAEEMPEFIEPDDESIDRYAPSNESISTPETAPVDTYTNATPLSNDSTYASADTLLNSGDSTIISTHADNKADIRGTSSSTHVDPSINASSKSDMSHKSTTNTTVSAPKTEINKDVSHNNAAPRTGSEALLGTSTSTSASSHPKPAMTPPHTSSAEANRSMSEKVVPQNKAQSFDHIPEAKVNAPTTPPTSGSTPAKPHKEGMYVDARDTLGTERATYSIRQTNNATGMEEIKHYDAEFKHPALNPDVLADSRYKQVITQDGSVLYAKTTPKADISKEGTVSPIQKDIESSAEKGNKNSGENSVKNPTNTSENKDKKDSGAKREGTKPEGRPRKGRKKK